MASIVVGVDGSANSIAALRWADRQAERTGASIRAVFVWEFPYGGLMPSPLGFSVPPQVDLQGDAEVRLDDILREAELSPDRTIERVVRQGAPAAVLLDEAERDAELVVVGARGHGGFTGLLVGSVATQVVNHAKVPTVVVPVPKES